MLNELSVLNPKNLYTPLVRMGIDPNIWGPNAWTFIHLMILSEKEPFDTTRLAYYEQFFNLLKHLLPCESCRQHVSEHLTKMPELSSLTTKRALFDWSVTLHNHVNEMLKKKTWDLNQAYNHWIAVSLGKRSYPGQWCKTDYWKYTTVVCVLLLILLVYKQFSYKGRRN